MSYILVTRNYPPCPYCKVGKAHLDRQGIAYNEVDISEVPEELGIRSIPMLFKDTLKTESILGGIDYIRSHKL